MDKNLNQKENEKEKDNKFINTSNPIKNKNNRNKNFEGLSMSDKQKKLLEKNIRKKYKNMFNKVDFKNLLKNSTIENVSNIGNVQDRRNSVEERRKSSIRENEGKISREKLVELFIK